VICSNFAEILGIRKLDFLGYHDEEDDAVKILHFFSYVQSLLEEHFLVHSSKIPGIIKHNNKVQITSAFCKKNI